MELLLEARRARARLALLYSGAEPEQLEVPPPPPPPQPPPPPPEEKP